MSNIIFLRNYCTQPSTFHSYSHSKLDVSALIGHFLRSETNQIRHLTPIFPTQTRIACSHSLSFYFLLRTNHIHNSTASRPITTAARTHRSFKPPFIPISLPSHRLVSFFHGQQAFTHSSHPRPESSGLLIRHLIRHFPNPITIPPFSPVAQYHTHFPELGLKSIMLRYHRLHTSPLPPQSTASRATHNLAARTDTPSSSSPPLPSPSTLNPPQNPLPSAGAPLHRAHTHLSTTTTPIVNPPPNHRPLDGHDQPTRTIACSR